MSGFRWTGRCGFVTDSGVMLTPEFDRFVADRQKAEAQVLKQLRLSKEELEAATKRKKDRNKKGDKDKTDADGED